MLTKLQALFNTYTGRDDIVLREDSVILRDLGMNSYELVSLVCAAEDCFGVEIPDRQVTQIRTVGDFLRLLEN
ncbi:MAG: phosphopantetheine-binding protein [Oscillospiraceae bacterium]|jgi:acyl carrier protein|nr:phosphopantetheine-binding protein [Oscillospiraceae bacterium]